MQNVSEIKPTIVDDINSWLLFEKKSGNIYSIGSLKKDKYIQLPEKLVDPIKTAIKYFDGNHSLNNIEEILMHEYNLKLNTYELYDLLCKANLIEGIDESLVEKQEMDYLSITLKEVKLDKIYCILDKLSGPFFPYIMYSSMIIILISIFFFVKNINVFISGSSYTLLGSYTLGILFGLVLFIVSIGIHEFAHGIMGYRVGLKPSKLVFSLYVATPMFYLKMPGIYSIKPKERIYVWIAGVYANLILASISIILSSFFTGNLKNMFFLFSISNISFIWANLSPLLPLDGYFIMSTLLKRPNLRKSSFKEFKKWALGKKNKFRGLSIVYFIASNLFIGVIIAVQLNIITKTIINVIDNQLTVYQAFYEFRYILIILLIIIIKKLVECILKYKHKKQNQYNIL